MAVASIRKKTDVGRAFWKCSPEPAYFATSHRFPELLFAQSSDHKVAFGAAFVIGKPRRPHCMPRRPIKQGR